MSELFADDYPRTYRRCGMDPWLYVAGVTAALVLTLAVLVVWGRYFGGDDPPG